MKRLSDFVALPTFDLWCWSPGENRQISVELQVAAYRVAGGNPVKVPIRRTISKRA